MSNKKSQIAIAAAAVALFVVVSIVREPSRSQTHPKKRIVRKMRSSESLDQASRTQSVTDSSSFFANEIPAPTSDQVLSMSNEQFVSLTESEEWGRSIHQSIAAIPQENLQGDQAPYALAELFGPINERLHQLQANQAN